MNSSFDTQPQDISVMSFAYPVVGMEQLEEVEESPAPAQTVDIERISKEQGILEGLERARGQYQEQLTRERAALQSAVHQFNSERAAYYERVESEVVGLALAIARKILHREAQVDKLLLSGVVQVALRKIDAGTRVTLLVNPSETEAWKESIARFALADRPEIECDAAISAGSCVLRTEMGELGLGIEPQLKEIENGILDLLAKRPDRE